MKWASLDKPTWPDTVEIDIVKGAKIIIEIDPDLIDIAFACSWAIISVGQFGLGALGRAMLKYKAGKDGHT